MAFMSRPSVTVDNVTIEQSGTTIGLKAGGIDTLHLADLSATGPKLGPQSVSADKLASGLLTLTEAMSADVLAGTLPSGAWTDYDLSAIIPANVTVALILMESPSGIFMGARANGSAIDRRWDTRGAGVQTILVDVSASKTVEFYGNGAVKAFYVGGLIL